MLLAGICLGMGLLSGGTAEAGVRGSAFTGSITKGFGVGSPLTIAFSNGNTAVYTEDLPNEPLETFQGLYTEFDLVLFSFVNFTGQDSSGDGIFIGSGFSLFGVILVMNYENPDFAESDWQGIYFRSGSARAGSGKSSSGAAGGN